MTTGPADGQTLLKEGKSALAQGKWEEGVASLAAAAAARPDDPEAWEWLANARMWLQETDLEIEARQRAYALYRERGDDASSARVSLDLVWDYLEIRGEMAVANGWFQRARRLLEHLPPTPEHALLKVFEANMTTDTDPAEAERHAREAVEIAHQVGAADIGVLALAQHGLALVSEGRVTDGMSLLDEALAGVIGREISDPQWYYFACCCMIDACDRVRDFGRSLEWCDRLREFAEDWRVQDFVTSCRIKYTGALLWKGKWETCEAQLERAIQELGSRLPGSLAAASVRLAELRRRQGRGREAAELLDRARSHPQAIPVRAALAMDDGDAATAGNLADGLLRRLPLANRTDRVIALELKARAAALLGDVEEAQPALDELKSIAERLDTDALRAAYHAAVGAVAASAQEHEQARVSFEEAVYLFDVAGSVYEAARARIGLAHALVALDRVSQAELEAASALAALDAIGAIVEARRARALLLQLDRDGGAAKPFGIIRDRRDPAVLTRRQQEILALVAQGMNDRDIADRLFLSEHTVHRHVANILSRLGVSSRSAAVAQAMREEMLR